MLGRGKFEKQLLPASFSPGNCDIICHIGGRTRPRFDNKRFKQCIEGYLGTYLMADSRSTKSAVITDIVSAIRASSKRAGDVGFVRFDSFVKRWYEVADRVARDKVGHYLRDATTKARKMRQREDAHPKRKTPIPLVTTNKYFAESQFESSAKKCLSHPFESTTTMDLCDWFEPRKMWQREDDHPKRKTPIPLVTTNKYFAESQFESSAKKCLSHPFESTTTMDLCDWFEAEMR